MIYEEPNRPGVVRILGWCVLIMLGLVFLFLHWM